MHRILPIVLVGIILLVASPASADVINLALSLSQPDSGFFQIGDHVTATLRMTDANGNALRADEYANNGLTLVQMWVSGPRQNYLSMPGFAPLAIQSTAGGFNRNSGFDPASGSIDFEIGDNGGGSGSYTVLFKCIRRVNNSNTTRYVQADFLVGQSNRTRTPFFSWKNCQSCHGNIPSRHSTNAIANCVVCHTKDFGTSFAGAIHGIGEHPTRQVGRCTACHKVGAGLDHFRRTSCFTCHSVGNAPDGHANYADDECAGCHTGNNSPWARHQIAVPNAPGAFDLTAPADNANLPWDSLDISTRFTWGAARNADNGDVMTYRLQLSRDPEFGSVQVWDSVTVTNLTVHHLQESSTYYWRVKACDLNTEGAYCNNPFAFATGSPPEPPPPPENHPPSEFSLVSPADTAKWYAPIDDANVTMTWERSVDLDSMSQVTYRLNLSARIWVKNDTSDFVPYDSILVFNELRDTSFTHNFAGLYKYGTDIWVRWGVQSISGGDTVSSREVFSFTLLTVNSVTPSTELNSHDFGLIGAYPNPFNSATSIDFTLPVAATASVAVFDVYGREIAQLGSGSFGPGRHSVRWDAVNVGAGVYFVRLESAGRVASQKVVLIK